MNKLTLIHTKDQFKLMIDETEIKCVSGYDLKADSNYQSQLELNLKMTIEVKQIDVTSELDGESIIRAINKAQRQTRKKGETNGS